MDTPDAEDDPMLNAGEKLKKKKIVADVLNIGHDRIYSTFIRIQHSP